MLPEARWGERGTRRAASSSERAQRAGVTLQPRMEVQHAGGLAGARGPRSGRHARDPACCSTVLGYQDRLPNRPLVPPLRETFAFIQRRNARLSPATRALMTLAEEHLARL